MENENSIIRDDRDFFGVYVIVNTIAKAKVTDLFTCENDAMASYGFLSFVSKVKEPVKDTNFSLIRLGTFDTKNFKITCDPEEFFPLPNYVVCKGKQEAENVVAHAEEEDFE